MKMSMKVKLGFWMGKAKVFIFISERYKALASYSSLAAGCSKNLRSMHLDMDHVVSSLLLSRADLFLGCIPLCLPISNIT